MRSIVCLRHAKIRKKMCENSGGSRPVRGPKGRKQGVGSWGRGSKPPPHQLGDLGERCKFLTNRVGAEPQPKSNLVHFGLKMSHLVAKIWTIFMRINRPNFGNNTQKHCCVNDWYEVMLCCPHSLENMDNGQKSCSALGIFIQYN